MPKLTDVPKTWIRRIIILSLLLFFFTVPHTLEDFATGEPAEAGVPVAVLSLVISTLFAAQALGLYWLGQKRRIGLVIHIAIGLFWPIASGLAQLPSILSENVYRSGTISVLYVLGMIIIGLVLCLTSIMALRAKAA